MLVLLEIHAFSEVRIERLLLQRQHFKPGRAFIEQLPIGFKGLGFCLGHVQAVSVIAVAQALCVGGQVVYKLRRDDLVAYP